MDRLISEKQVLDAIADFIKNNDSVAKLILSINAIPSAEPSEDAISRQAVLDVVNNPLNIRLDEIIQQLPSVKPQEPKTGYISIDDVMSVFDDFMCGEVDEEGTNTFLEMLKDKAERSK